MQLNIKVITLSLTHYPTLLPSQKLSKLHYFLFELWHISYWLYFSGSIFLSGKIYVCAGIRRKPELTNHKLVVFKSTHQNQTTVCLGVPQVSGHQQMLLISVLGSLITNSFIRFDQCVCGRLGPGRQVFTLQWSLE